MAAKLGAAITLGEYMPGAKLPSEAALGTLYRDGETGRPLSRITVRGALARLAGEGLVESVQGSGWYVRGDHRLRFPLLDFNANRLGATADVWNAWIASLEKAGTSHLRVSTEVPPLDVQRDLQSKIGEEATVRHRVRCVDGEPWALSVAYWPRWLSAGTPLGAEGEGDAVDMQNPSPLAWAAAQGYPSLRDEYVIGSRMPTETEAEILDTGRGVPLITMSTISTTVHHQRLRRTDDIFPAHRFLLVVTQEHP
jgi:GntR family transcriptional regulator